MPTSANAYYPYDSGAGANVAEAGWRNFMGRLSPSAVFAGVTNELAPSGDSTGMQVKVATGAAWVRGAYGEWTGITTLPIAAVGGIAGGSSRIDSVIARNDFVNNRMELDVLTGTAGVTPAAPTLTQSSSIWEILLGNVGPLVNTTTTITAAMVSDGRWKMTPSGVLYHEQSPVGLATVTLPGAGSFPTGYRDLVIRGYGRTDKAAATNEIINLRFNGDSSASSHTWSALVTTGATPAGAVPSAATSASIGLFPAAVASASLPGMFWIDVPEYASTTFVKTCLSRMGFHSGGTGFEMGLFQANWNVATALTSIVLFTAASGNYLTGTRFVVEMRP